VSPLLLIVAMAVPASADAPPIPPPYHSGAGSVCSDCHSMHFSQGHSWTGPDPVSATGALGGDWLGPTGPNRKLLKSASAAELCLACHDGLSQVPDVMMTDVNGLAERAAGFFETPLDVASFKGHNLGSDPNAGIPPSGGWELCYRCHFGGEMATATVTCIDCHSPHGRQSYRNLHWASDPDATPQITAFSSGSGVARYEQDNIGYAAPLADTTWREVSNICIDCHHVFSGPHYTSDGSGNSPYIRHPVTDSERGSRHPLDKVGANTDPANWVNGGQGFSIPRLPYIVSGATSYSEARVVASSNEVFCLSCHKAHGSLNPFGLRWAAYDTAGCQQCHGAK
jgi:predicted CXXCH cytochrome family protein